MTANLDLNNPFSPCETRKITALEFGILNPEFLKSISVCEITSTELYENGMMKTNGLNDIRMGTTDHRVLCETCNMDVKHCPGHFGRILLAKPIYHYGFIKTVIKVLRCVCYGCSKLLVGLDDPKLRNISKIRMGSHRLRRIFDAASSKKRCEGNIREGDPDSSSRDGCGCIQPKYIRDGPNILIQIQDSSNDYDDGREETKGPLTAEEAHNILKRISDEDMKLMGFNPIRSRPCWMILTVLPISPPVVRPYVQYGSDRSEDDLTLKLLDIVKINNQLKRQEQHGAASHIISEISQLLQYHITTMFDNDIPGVPVATTRSKKPIKSIRARLKGKEGRLRGNLMGKRVDFSARTVITGDPNMPIDVIGVPKSIAMTLTFAETVTPLNYDKMKKLVDNGPYNWPGAKYVTRDDGTRFDLRHVQKTSEQQLEYGYRVERHMQNGDYILFNRQPSLHKMSIMGHSVKILPYSTFRLNLSVTSPYNADFDGDEMNLHLAQSHETRSEIKHLMMVPKQIVSPQGNKPVMGIVQDALLGISKFTKRDNFLTKNVVMDLLMWIPYWNGILPTPAIIYPQQLWTGKQLITVLLDLEQAESTSRTKINLLRDSAITTVNEEAHFYENDAKVIIQRGELLAGVVCKRTVGSSSGSLIHVLWHEAGAERVKDFLSAAQKVVNAWLVINGFTVGCSDILASDKTLKKVVDILDKSKLEVQNLVRQSQAGKLECQPGKSLLESFESRVNKELNSARDLSGKLASETLDQHNNILSMVNAGSKGSSINISQIIACVGQQNVEGKRIPFGFSNRSLPHFIKHDYGPESRGFVSNSYLSGLTPQEMFFHAMGGREGIIDTACKTSETGYIQRRLIKALEDVMVKYDKTVRNSCGDILQFLYGEDGMNAEYIENQNIDLLLMDNDNFDHFFKHHFNDENYGNGWIYSNQIRSQIILGYTQQSILENEYNTLKELKEKICTEIFTDGSSKQHLPLNIPRLIEYAKNQFPTSQMEKESLNPISIATMVNELLEDKLKIVISTKKNDIISQEVDKNSKLLISAHIRSLLNSKRLLKYEKIGPKAIDWLFGEIDRQFNKSLAHPGECVGAIAAQSIGEPATQMTLNTFHFAGVGSKNVTLGVPRLRELINVAKTVKTPSLTIYLEELVATDQERAKDVQTRLEHTTLDKVTAFAQIIYDPDPESTIIEEDLGLVSDYYAFPDEEGHPKNLGPWLLRIVLTNKMMIDKKLTMKEIGEKIYQEFSNDEIDCIWTDDNSRDLVLRIRVKSPDSPKDSSDNNDNSESEDKLLQVLMGQCLANITLRGISGISKVYMREEPRNIYLPSSGKFHRQNNWVLDTDGCNLEGVLPMPHVDPTRTTSNSMTEIFKIFGIEAVRKALLRELRTVISFDNSYVNYRHLAILCDTMTQEGHLTPITRHGINRIDRGPLLKCSFEETVEILLDAAVYGETDPLHGVSENIMFGQLAPLGTGDFDLLIDEDKLKDANQNLDIIPDMSLEPFTSPETGQLVTPEGAQTPTPLSVIMSPAPFSPTYVTTGSIASPLPQQQQRFDEAASSKAGNFPHSPQSPYNVDTLQLGGKFSPVEQFPSALNIMSPGSPVGDIGNDMFSPAPESPRSPYSPGPASYDLFGDSSSSPLPYLSAGLSSQSPYSPTSPYNTGSNRPSAFPFSPHFSPDSAISPNEARMTIDQQKFNPVSPVYQPGGSPVYSPNTRVYSPTSPIYSPMYSPIANQPVSGLSPTSPSFLVTSPRYSPTSPSYIPPQSPNRVGFMSPSNTIQSPQYSPTSPTNDIFSPDYNMLPEEAEKYSPTSPSVSNPQTGQDYDFDLSIFSNLRQDGTEN